MWVDVPDLRRDKWKNRAKTGKIAQFLRPLKGDFYHLSLNGKNNSRVTSLTQTTLSELRIKPVNSKKTMFLKTFKPFPEP